MSDPNYQQIIPFKGTSMSPLIKEGDKVVVDLYPQPKPLSTNFAGKICFYNDGSEWVVHRVLNFENDAYIKGDFAKSFDSNSSLNVWGQVRKIQTSKGRIIEFDCNSKYNLLCEKLSIIHMTSSGIKGKLGKLLLYILNSLKRNFSFFGF